MHFRTHDIALILVGIIATAWATRLVVRRKVYKQFSWFFVYLVLSLIIPFVRLSLVHNYTTYFYVYWGTEAVYAVVAILTLHQVFHEVFLSFYTLWWWFKFIFPGAVALIAFTSIRSVPRLPAPMFPFKVEIIVAFAGHVNYLEAALFGLFFGLVLLLGVRWRSYPFGIVEGFGLYALGALVGFKLRSEFGTKYIAFFKYAPPVAYLLAVLVWVDTFRHAPEPEPDWRLTPQQMLQEARSQLQIVKRFFGRHNHV